MPPPGSSSNDVTWPSTVRTAVHCSMSWLRSISADVAVFAGLSNVPRTRVFETRAMAILPGAAGVL